MIVVETGPSFMAPRAAKIRGDALEQRQLKAMLIAEAWRDGGIDAVALGAADWRLGTGFMTEVVATTSLPVLAANLTCDGAAPYPSHTVIERAGHRIGIVGVTIGEVEGCEVSEVAPALQVAVEAMGTVDVTVALLPAASDRELADWTSSNLPVDVVLDARGRHATTIPDQKGGAWAFGAGSRGKHLGVLQLTWNPGATRWAPDNQVEAVLKRQASTRARLDNVAARIPQTDDPGARSRLEAQQEAYGEQLADIESQLSSLQAGAHHRLAAFEVPLSDDVADHPATAAQVAEAKRGITMRAGGDPGRFIPRMIDSGPYAGGATCVPCHKEQHSQWSTTGHARAWLALVREERALDDDCWSCHVTGFEQPGGPPDPTKSGPWRDVQCEACHGPARAHVESPGEVLPVRDPDEATCVGCHDGDQDGGRFDYPSYRPKIAHPAAPPPDAVPPG